MKKFELHNLSIFLGNELPANKIVDRDTRIAIVRLYGSIALAYKGVADEIEETRKALVGDKQAEIEQYSKLMLSSMDKTLSETERKEAKEKAEAMSECAKIDADFNKALEAINNEEIDPEIKKVPLEVLYEALVDCDFKGLTHPLSLAETKLMFNSIIL